MSEEVHQQIAAEPRGEAQHLGRARPTGLGREPALGGDGEGVKQGEEREALGNEDQELEQEERSQRLGDARERLRGEDSGAEITVRRDQGMQTAPYCTSTLAPAGGTAEPWNTIEFEAAS